MPAEMRMLLAIGDVGVDLGQLPAEHIHGELRSGDIDGDGLHQRLREPESEPGPQGEQGGRREPRELGEGLRSRRLTPPRRFYAFCLH
jgi:hypothetical protein